MRPNIWREHGLLGGQRGPAGKGTFSKKGAFRYFLTTDGVRCLMKQNTAATMHAKINSGSK